MDVINETESEQSAVEQSTDVYLCKHQIWVNKSK